MSQDHHRPSFHLIIPPVILIVIGVAIYTLIAQLTTPEIQTLTVEPLPAQSTGSSQITPSISNQATGSTQ